MRKQPPFQGGGSSQASDKEFEKIKKEYHNYLGLIHRDDGPAVIYYTKSGKIKSEFYNKNNDLSRHDGPAVIYYDHKGIIQTDNLFYLGGKRFFSLKELKASILD